MSGTLIFIENSDEINLLIDHIKVDTIVISMQPSVSIELEKRGLKYQNTLKFFGVNGHNNVIERSTQIVEELRPFIEGLGSQEIKYAFEKTWIFHFRFFLHYWLATIYVIHKVVEFYNPDKLITLRLNRVSQLDMNVTGNNRILGIVVEKYGKAHGIKVHCIDNFIKTSKIKLLSTLLKQKLSAVAFEVLLRIYPFFSHNKVALLVPDDSYNMSSFLDKVGQNIKRTFPVYLGKQHTKISDLIGNIVKGNSFSFIAVPVDNSFAKVDKFNNKLDICISKIQAWLVSPQTISNFYGVGLNDPLLEFIENGMSKGMLSLHGATITLQRVIDVVKPQYVFSQHSLGMSYALGEYCVYKSIPALLIPHASYVPHLGTLPHLEWSVHAHTIINSRYPFVAVQSPWALKFAKEQKNFVSKVIETGPLLFSKKNNLDIDYKKSRKIFKNFSHKKILLHASTPKGWSVFRPLIFETYDEYIRNLTDIIETVESNPDIYLAIRFRPTDGLSLSDLQASLPHSSSYDIYVDGSFEQYLLESDILISYSSTTIEEALQNHVPVLQYDPDGKYMHIPGERLSKSDKKRISSVYSVYDKTDLFDAIGWLNSVDINNPDIDWSKHIISNSDDMDWLYQLM